MRKIIPLKRLRRMKRDVRFAGHTDIANNSLPLERRRKYYAKKGMKATVVKQDGRFIEANVIKNSKIIDRVLLDCRTGRIRSIY